MLLFADFDSNLRIRGEGQQIQQIQLVALTKTELRLKTKENARLESFYAWRKVLCKLAGPIYKSNGTLDNRLWSSDHFCGWPHRPTEESLHAEGLLAVGAR